MRLALNMTQKHDIKTQLYDFGWLGHLEII